MQLVGTQIHEESGAKPSYIVEFVGDGGEVISVQMQQSASGDLTRLNAVEKAKVLLLHIASLESEDIEVPTTERVEIDPNISPAVQSLEAAKQDGEDDTEDDLEKGLMDSFPASDPISVTSTTTAGAASEKPAER